MQRQIIKVNDINKAIQETGLEYYVDRLLQDANGDYYWVDHSRVELGTEWKHENTVTMTSRDDHPTDPTEMQMSFRYDILKIPKEVAWMCIDAMRLQSEILGIGGGGYEGPHGGKMYYFKTSEDGKKMDEIGTDIVRVEEL